LLSIVLGEVALEGDDLAAQRLGAEEFARALAGGGNPVAELAVALRCAHQPRAIDELALERALRRGFGRGRERTMVPIVAAMVAVAAAVALWFVSTSPVHEGSGRAAEAAARAALIAPHSTDALFEPSTPFPATGGESERLEKIVSARATDLRANRFARWGVR
jgi:hypothetical protein